MKKTYGIVIACKLIKNIIQNEFEGRHPAYVGNDAPKSHWLLHKIPVPSVGCENSSGWARKVAQVKTHSTKPDNLSSKPGKKRTDSYKSFDLHMYCGLLPCIGTCTK